MNKLIPTPKVTTGGIAGIIVTFILYELTTRFHINVDASESAFVTTMVSFLSSYLAPKSEPSDKQKADIIQEHEDKPNNVPPSPTDQRWNTQK